MKAGQFDEYTCHLKACNRSAMKVSGASSVGTLLMADFKDREVLFPAALAQSVEHIIRNDGVSVFESRKRHHFFTSP